MSGRAGQLALAIAVIACSSAVQTDDPEDRSTTDAAGSDLGLARDFRIVLSQDAGDGSALFGLDLENGAAEQLIEPMGYAGYAVWAPDGARVVFLGGGADGVALRALDAESGKVTELIAGIGDPVDFSPDGSTMLLTLDLEEGGGAITFESGRDGNPEIYRHDLETGATERLTDNSGLDEWPSFSPSGTQIAWASGGEERKHLWVMQADGSDKRQLTDSLMFGDAYPEWSPDGQQILLTVNTDDGPALYLIDLATRAATPVGPGAAPTWR